MFKVKYFNISMDHLVIHLDASGSQKFNSATHEPKVFISRHLDDIEAKFKQTSPYFLGQRFKWIYHFEIYDLDLFVIMIFHVSISQLRCNK